MNHAQIMQQERVLTAALHRQNTAQYWLLQIYRAHPEVKPCKANEDLIINHFDGEPTLEGFEHDYEELKGSLAMWSEQERRDQLEKQIMALLPAMSPDAKANLRHQFQAKMPNTSGAFAEQAGAFLISTASMERQLQNLQTGKAYEGFSVEQLTEEVKSQRTINGFPEMPREITRTQLLLIAREQDSFRFKKMIQVYGLAQVNARLAQK